MFFKQTGDGGVLVRLTTHGTQIPCPTLSELSREPRSYSTRVLWPLEVIPTPQDHSLTQSALVFDNPSSGACISHQIGDFRFPM